MNSRIVIGVVAFLAAMSCGIFLGLVTFAMIGEINRKVPESERISYLWGHPAKYLRIFREYRRLYPDGRLNRVAIALYLCMMVLLAVFAWWLRKFGGPLGGV